jgi:ATP-binding cassette, subfamily B, bacterial PglK
MTSINNIKEVLYLMGKRKRLIFLLLVLSVLVSAALELFGLSCLIPIVNVVSNPSSIHSTSYLEYLYQLFNFTSDRSFLIFLVVAVIGLYLFKMLFEVFLSYLDSRFSNSVIANVASRLFARLLGLPYSYHTMHSSSEAINLCSTELDCFGTSLSSLLTLLSTGIISLFIVGMLFFVNWLVAAVVVTILLLVSLLTYYLVKKRLNTIGKRTVDRYTENTRILQESLGSVKELKISNLQSYFVQRFHDNRFWWARLGTEIGVVGSLPRLIIEGFGIVAMLLAILITLLRGASGATIMATFSVFAVAVVKLLPYVSKISSCFTNFSYTAHPVHSIYVLLSNPPVQEEELQPDAPAFSFQSKIEIRDLSFHYPDSKDLILSHTSFSIPKNSSFALFGPSGMGKTTTLDLLLGLHEPTGGGIFCDGRSIKESPFQWRKMVAYVPQSIYLLDDSILANVAFGISSDKIDEKKVWSALHMAALDTFVMSLPSGLQTRIGELGSRLSGGQRQRIGIARALYKDAPILVLDEATSALDYETEKEILSSVEKLKDRKTLIVVTHRLGTIAGFDAVYTVVGKKVVKAPKPQ